MGPWVLPFVLFWGAAAGLLLPLNLLLLHGPLTLWPYGAAAGITAAAVAAGIAQRWLRCGGPWSSWVGAWLMIGGLAGLAVGVVGFITFMVDTGVRSGEGIGPGHDAALGFAILLALASGALAAAVIEGIVLALVSIPLMLLGRALVCRMS